MKFFQTKYLALYLTVITTLAFIVMGIQYNHQDFHVPVYVLATPFILVYTFLSIIYFFLKERKEQSIYFNIFIDFGLLILVIFTILLCAFILEIFDLEIEKSFGSNRILLFMFSYQILVVIYAFVTSLIIAIKSLIRSVENKKTINKQQ